MPKSIILNSTNIVPNTYNSEFLYSFPNGGVIFKDDLIAIQQVSIYNSVFNISSAQTNDKFSYIWVDGTTHLVDLPDSYLDVAGINSFFQSVMFANRHYLTTATGTIVYLMEIVVNASQYAFQFNSYLISTTIATTNAWTIAPSASWVLPTNSICPMLVIPNTNIQDLLGFPAGTYPNTVIAGTPPAQTQTPSQSISYSVLSTTAPQIIPTPTYLVACSLVQNKLAIPSQLIFSLTISDTVFGGLYTTQVSSPVFNNISDGQYSDFKLRFVDRYGNKVVFNDPNTMILMIIKNRSEIS
jgi:hypothetical protein